MAPITPTQWLDEVEKLAGWYSRRWGEGVAESGPLEGDDAIRAVLRDAYARIAREARSLTVGLETWKYVTPRPKGEK